MYEQNALLLRQLHEERAARKSKQSNEKTDVFLHSNEKTDVPLTNENKEKKKVMMVIDLTDDSIPISTEYDDLLDQEPIQDDYKPKNKRRRNQVKPQRVLPSEDIELLQEAEEEFFEQIPKKTLSIDRRDRKRGTTVDNPIYLNEDDEHFICDCVPKCINKYTCENGHIQCKETLKLLQKKTTSLFQECYICSSRVL